MAKERLTVTRNELLEAIKAAREPEYPDAMTVPEIMASLNLSRSQVRTLLGRINAQRVKVRRMSVDGRSQLVGAYRLK